MDIMILWMILKKYTEYVANLNNEYVFLKYVFFNAIKCLILMHLWEWPKL